MRIWMYLIVIFAVLLSCNTPKSSTSKNSNNSILKKETVRIVDDSLEYEILVIDPGFSSWLVFTAKPEGFYSQDYMEIRNRAYVSEWNLRVLQPLRYDSNLYEMQIDYQPNINYGYEVNYKLYNYFIYFQLTYKQRLGTFTPRI